MYRVEAVTKWAFGVLVAASYKFYWDGQSPVLITTLDPHEQYIRKDNWFWTNTAQYRANANRLACNAKIDKLFRTAGGSFDGPINFQDTIFERDGNDFKCSILINSDVANDFKAKRGF